MNYMKTLNCYMQDAQTELFNRLGVFFAFSNAQIEEQRKPGVEYTTVGAGMIVPKDNAKEVVESLEAIYKTAIAEDLAENGINAIIDRELQNYECYYTHEIDDCADALEDYGIVRDQVWFVYNRERHNHTNY